MNSVQKISQQCLAVRLRALNRLITSIYDEELRPSGLRISQLNLLVAIGFQKEVSAKQICQMLSLDESTMSRDLVTLMKQGWVTSTPLKTDKRSKILKLSSSGLKKISAVEEVWEKAQLRAQEAISKNGMNSIKSIVNNLWGFPSPT